MTGGASRQGAQPCPVCSLPGRPAKRIRAAKGDLILVNELTAGAAVQPGETKKAALIKGAAFLRLFRVGAPDARFHQVLEGVREN